MIVTPLICIVFGNNISIGFVSHFILVVFKECGRLTLRNKVSFADFVLWLLWQYVTIVYRPKLSVYKLSYDLNHIGNLLQGHFRLICCFYIRCMWMISCNTNQHFFLTFWIINRVYDALLWISIVSLIHVLNNYYGTLLWITTMVHSCK